MSLCTSTEGFYQKFKTLQQMLYGFLCNLDQECGYQVAGKGGRSSQKWFGFYKKCQRCKFVKTSVEQDVKYDFLVTGSDFKGELFD